MNARCDHESTAFRPKGAEIVEKTRIHWRAAAAAQTEACSLLGSHRLLQARLSPDSAVVLLLSEFFRSALHGSAGFLCLASHATFPTCSDFSFRSPNASRHHGDALRRHSTMCSCIPASHRGSRGDALRSSPDCDLDLRLRPADTDWIGRLDLRPSTACARLHHIH